MHLVGFTKEMYHDARSYEHQINSNLYIIVKHNSLTIIGTMQQEFNNKK
jgi:hypothetical protein